MLNTNKVHTMHAYKDAILRTMTSIALYSACVGRRPWNLFGKKRSASSNYISRELAIALSVKNTLILKMIYSVEAAYGLKVIVDHADVIIEH